MAVPLIDETGQQINFRVRAGQIWNRSITFEFEDDTVLSYYSEIIMQCRRKPSSDVLFEASISNGKITVLDNTLTISNVRIPDTPGVYRYDLDFINEDDNLHVSYIYGNIIIVDQITKE